MRNGHAGGHAAQLPPARCGRRPAQQIGNRVGGTWKATLDPYSASVGSLVLKMT
jgi:hypothetical protein